MKIGLISVLSLSQREPLLLPRGLFFLAHGIATLVGFGEKRCLKTPLLAETCLRGSNQTPLSEDTW